MEKLHEPIPPDRLKRNLETIRAKMAQALAKASRSADAVRLVAVTKYVGLEEVRALRDLGVKDFGESRIQDAEKKIKELGPSAAELNWHLIGHLQTNKADKAAKLFRTVHSVDSLRVAQALDKESRKLGKPPLLCLLEVNVAGEANKFGLPPESKVLSELLEQCAGLDGIKITGLMSMAPYADNPEPTSRPVFKKLRELFEALNDKKVYPHALTELSMGMTQDFDIAIEEGATVIRVGSALFE